MNVIEGLIDAVEKLKKEVERLKMRSHPEWVYLTTPLTSTSWDGDSFSTTASTALDLSAVFSAPAGIKAVLLYVRVNDSAAWGTSGLSISLGPSATKSINCAAYGGDVLSSYSPVVPCDANGDIYYEIAASGASTMDIYIRIWGYMI